MELVVQEETSGAWCKQAKCSLRKDTAGICELIRETFTREGDNLQKIHKNSGPLRL